MRSNRLLVAVLTGGLLVGMALPAGAAPPERGDFARTECVYATGAPDIWESPIGDVIHYRNFPYIGFLTDEGGQAIGQNSGMVDIDLNVARGTGWIRGTLAVRDEVMGDFDGHFRGKYREFLWSGRGFARGVDDSWGAKFRMAIEAIPPPILGDVCPTLPGYGAAVDGALWTVSVKYKKR